MQQGYPQRPLPPPPPPRAGQRALPPLHPMQLAEPVGPLPGPGFKKAILLLDIGGIVFLLMGIVAAVIGVAAGVPQVLILAYIFGLLPAGLMQIASQVFGVVWMNKMWTWLPVEERRSSLWNNWISPGMAVGFLFLPYFNFYWMFVVTLGLADAVSRLRVRHGGAYDVDRNVGIWVPLVAMFVPFGRFAWLRYMSDIERAAHDIDARRAPQLQQAFRNPQLL